MLWTHKKALQGCSRGLQLCTDTRLTVALPCQVVLRFILPQTCRGTSKCNSDRMHLGQQLEVQHLSLMQEGFAALLMALQPGIHVKRQLLPAWQLLARARNFQPGRHLSTCQLWLHGCLDLHLYDCPETDQGGRQSLSHAPCKASAYSTVMSAGGIAVHARNCASVRLSARLRVTLFCQRAQTP